MLKTRQDEVYEIVGRAGLPMGVCGRTFEFYYKQEDDGINKRADFYVTGTVTGMIVANGSIFLFVSVPYIASHPGKLLYISRSYENPNMRWSATTEHSIVPGEMFIL